MRRLGLSGNPGLPWSRELIAQRAENLEFGGVYGLCEDTNEPIAAAAFGRDSHGISLALAVVVSSMDIDEVRAANSNMRKNAALMMLPPGIAANAVERVTKIRPGPSEGLRP